MQKWGTVEDNPSSLYPSLCIKADTSWRGIWDTSRCPASETAVSELVVLQDEFQCVFTHIDQQEHVALSNCKHGKGHVTDVVGSAR